MKFIIDTKNKAFQISFRSTYVNSEPNIYHLWSKVQATVCWSYMFKLQLQASLLLDYYYENFNTALTL